MIYLIAPLHNDQARLRSFVFCLNAQTVKPFVIWVDSGTDDCDACEVRRYQGQYTCLRVDESNYWAGSLRWGQEWLGVNASPSDTVAIMNNDETFAPDFIEKMASHVREGRIVATIMDGVRVLWDRVWTRKYGAISAVPCWEPNALGNRAIFLTVKDFLKVRFLPWLPHYCSDYAWTYKAIKSGLEPFLPLDCDIKVDYSTTGITEPKNLKELFSRRCPHNPIYYSAFILLCCPWHWKVQNFVRVWGYSLVRAWRML